VSIRRTPDGNAGAAAFEEALYELGMQCSVVAMGPIVVITPKPGTDPSALSDASRRGELTAIAAAHGFTHVALQLPAV
jgi:hypothetical protein